MRNWNFRYLFCDCSTVASIYNTYEELKHNLLTQVFLRLLRIYNTYEELKLEIYALPFNRSCRIYNTYEELKLIKNAQYWKQNEWFIIPMRNWNLASSSAFFEAPPIYNTYEELKQRNCRNDEQWGLQDL